MILTKNLKEIVCSKFANSKGMRNNRCLSIDGTLPCAYERECDEFISAIISTYIQELLKEKNCNLSNNIKRR